MSKGGRAKNYEGSNRKKSITSIAKKFTSQIILHFGYTNNIFAKFTDK